MPTETQLEQRVAALQSNLNARDQAQDDAATESNERELSRRDWFDEAQRLQAELTSANADKEAYAQNAIDLRAKLETARAELRTEVEAGDSWRKEALDLQRKLAERDALLRDVVDGKHATPGWNQRMKVALSASAEPAKSCGVFEIGANN